MNSTLKALAVALLVGTSSMASTNDGWAPSGTASLLVGTKSMNLRMSKVRYEDPYVMADLSINLPAGLVVQVTEYSGLNGWDLDKDSGDEIDLALLKKFQLAPETYLKFRVACYNILPVSNVNGNDVMIYDAYLGRLIKPNSHDTVTAELRLEYWHYVRDIEEGAISIMPGLSHERVIGNFVVYERLGLQWNEELQPFGELLSGQASLGLKAKLLPHLTWNAVEVTGFRPLNDVEVGDPRSENGDWAATSSIVLTF